MAHWLKASKKEIYLVQRPDEVAKTLKLAFPTSTEAISGQQYMRAAKALCPIPPGLSVDEPEPDMGTP